MKITDWKTNTFWKSELGVQATVEDQDRPYKVSLNIKGSQVYDYSCSCMEGESYRGMCPHARFVWEEWRRQQEEGGGKPVTTSREVRAMIREYTNREVARIVQESEDGQVRLVPRMAVKDGAVRLEFRVGKERLYVLRDLTAFVEAMENGALVTYGKQLSFHHGMEAFAMEDRPLCSFLMELVNLYREHFEQFSRSPFVTVRDLRELNLSLANRDRFLEMMEGRTVEVIRGDGPASRVLVKEGPVSLKIRIGKAGRDGIQVTAEPGLYGFAGERRWYLGGVGPTAGAGYTAGAGHTADTGHCADTLTCLTPEATGCLGVFLEQLLKASAAKGRAAYGPSPGLTVQNRDIPLFYERVLKKILPYIELTVDGVDLEDYRPQELRATFTFDSGRPGELTMRPVLSYGDFSFQPIEDDKVPRTVCRDVPGEFRVSRLITKYFSCRDQSGELLVIRDDEDAMYRLLSQGMREFMELGEVYVTDAARRIRVLPPPKVSVGVRTTGSWLELKIDAEGIDRAQLQRILSEYDRKKPYYRLKSGEFLQLDENGLVTVARLVEGLAVSRSELLAGTVRVPAYRAPYLDSMMKDGAGITFYRDNLFKAVVRGMKSVEDSDFVVPQGLERVLRGYQKTGFRWLKTLDAYGFCGILADDMGLGKTIQVIALLLDESRQHPESQSLIVCPASLVYNWENELHTFAPELPVRTVVGSAAEREAILKAAEDGDILVTSYDLLKRDTALYQPFSFRFQVIDEAQYIKNPGTQSAKAVKAVNSRTRFALTGTPIENRLSELWSIFDYLMPGFLFAYSRFKKDFETPIARDGSQDALGSLHRLTGPFVLRRLKRDVLKELPDKLETVVYSRPGEEQKRLYTAEAIKLKDQLEALSGAGMGAEKLQILAQLTRLRQLCCDPSLCCNHYKGGSAKLDTCAELVAGGIEGGHKILLFSQFTSMLDLIGKRLKKEGIAYHLLTGDTSKEERIRMAGAFQTDGVPVFLISLKAGGTGLNLTAADIVIHYDPWWNVAAQNQATDRTHRIGQEKQVTVFKLIMKDTIEENIVKLQEQKRDLAEQIITEGTLSLGSLTRDELIKILD